MVSDLYTLPGRVIIGDCYNMELEDVDFCLLDPPYNPSAEITALESFWPISKSLVCFMYPEDLYYIGALKSIRQGAVVIGPERIYHWTKPISTKNTSKKCSQFVESIAVWTKPKAYLNSELHWSVRTGIFTDTIVVKNKHPYQKPFSLIEKLVLLHTPPGGTVLDPFCGSQVVKEVCDKHGFKSLSIDIKDWTEKS